MRRRSEPPSAQHWRVLIADEDADERGELRRFLVSGSERHYEISEHSSGRAAAQAIVDAGAMVPDCVLLGDRLQDLNVARVLELLAAPDGLRLCPVVVVASADNVDIRRAALRAGAQDFVSKSWMSPGSLTHTVENAVARWEMTRELRASEAEAEQRDQHLRLALEASNTGIWTWDLKSDAVTWTAQARKIFGVSVEDEPEPTSAAFFRLIHAEDRAGVEARIRKALEERSVFGSEFRIVRPSSEVVWVHDLGRVTSDADGKPLSVVGTVSDISARKNAELALRTRERELQTLADNTPYIVARFDRALRHVFINAAVERATGRPCADFLGKTNRELGMPTELCDQWDDAIESVFQSGRGRALEFEFPSECGLRQFSARLVPELGEVGAVAYVLIVTEDITDRKRTDESLRAALRDAELAIRGRDQLASMVSHDLKNPLNNLRLAISILEPGQDPARRETLAKMSRQVRKMDLMVDELLDLAQLQSGKSLELELEETDLVELVQSSIDEHRQISSRHQIQLILGVNKVVGLWDSRRLERVLNNLLSNATKYSPNGGVIRVAIELSRVEAGGSVNLLVSDRGMGIPASDLERVFQWYSRADNTGQRKIQGHGIGLAGARDIVQQHGGTISAESVEGQGSTFTVTLPLRTPPAASA